MDQAGTNGQPVSTPSTAILQLPQTSGANNIDDANSVLGGAITLTYNTNSQTFIMGNDPGATNADHIAGAIYTGGTSANSLMDAINHDDALGLSATTGTGGTGALYLQGAAGVASLIQMSPAISASNTETPLGLVTSLGTTTQTGSTPVTAVTGVAAAETVNAASTISTNDIVAGSVTVVNTGTATGISKDATSTFAAAGSGTSATVTVLDTGAANTEANQVVGAVTLAVGNGGGSFTYTAQAGDTWQQMINAINNSTTIGTGVTNGVTATWNANAGGTGKGGILLTDNDATAAHAITVSNGATLKSQAVETFTMGAGANNAATNTYFTSPTNNGATQYGNSLSGLAAAISAVAGLQVTATATSNGLTLVQSQDNGGTITSSANSLTDVTAETPSTISSTEIASNNDTLSGALVFNVGGASNKTVTMANVTAGGLHPATAQGMVDYIHANSNALGIDATWVPDSGANANTSFGVIKLTSNTEGSGGTVNVSSTLTALTDTTVNASLSYTAGAAYNTGLSNGSVAVSDNNTGQAATFTSQDLKGSGIATISYSDQAGQSLSATDLTNSIDAKASLTALNAAITDVASQDGYIGAQINTLNSVSSVLATQQQNVVAAQNAVQATDYASAASNMSKYEILSQTGISALAQANSMQQEVTKLLQ